MLKTIPLIKRKIILLFIVMFCGIFVNAQDNKPLRVEIEAKSDFDAHILLPVGQKGILLLYQSNESADYLTKKWYISFYDVNFKETWNKYFAVQKDLSLGFADQANNKVYFYLEDGNKQSAKGNYQIVTIDVVTAEISSFIGSIPVNCAISGFKVLNNKAMLTGHTLPDFAQNFLQSCITAAVIPWIFNANMLKYHPFIYYVDLETKTEKMIPDPYKGQAYIENLEKDTISGNFILSIKNFIPRAENTMALEEYDALGNKTGKLMLGTQTNKRKLNTAKIASVKDDEKVIIGTYNNFIYGKQANPAFVGFSEGSNGLYFCKINKQGEQGKMNFYNFSEFKDFYSIIANRSAAKIMIKARKKALKGKEIAFDYKLLVHDIIVKDSAYIMIAEAYYPEYRSVTYTSYDSYGRPFTTTYTVFEGYRYTNTLIAAFNDKGELLWNNSFEIWNILSFNLNEKVKVLLDGDDIVMVYNDGENIASKIIRGKQVVEGKQYTKIETGIANDKLIGDYNSGMEYWYDNYFISYGYQKIKNTQQNKAKRTVFYFTKIAFQ